VNNGGAVVSPGRDARCRRHRRRRWSGVAAAYRWRLGGSGVTTQCDGIAAAAASGRSVARAVVPARAAAGRSNSGARWAGGVGDGGWRGGGAGACAHWRSAARAAGWDRIDVSAACPARAVWRVAGRAGRQAGRWGGSRAPVPCTVMAERATGDGGPPRRAPRHPPSFSRCRQRGVCAPRPRWARWGDGVLRARRLLRSRGGGAPQRGSGDGSTAAHAVRRGHRVGLRGGVRVPLVGGIAPGDGASSVAAAPRGWRRRSSRRQRKSRGVAVVASLTGGGALRF